MSAAVRVVHIVPSLQGYGAERQVFDLLPCLQSHEISTGVVTIYDSAPASTPPFEVVSASRAGPRDYFFLHRLVDQLRRLKPDVVHAHTHVGKYWGRIAAVLAGVRNIVFTEHNPCDPRRTPLESVLDPLLHHYTARVITFFSEQRNELSARDRIPVEKIVTIPNGLPADCGGDHASKGSVRAALGIPCERFMMIVPGRLEFQKNQQLALRALAALDPAVRSGVHLCLAGAGSDDQALRDLARRLEIEERVSFLGYRNDIRALMQACDAILMTSLFEGMPLTFIEGMIAGAPIISTPWTGVREMLCDGRYGFISPGWQPQDVGEAIERALKSPGARDLMAERARQYALETYTISRMARAHRALYLSLSRE